MSENLQDIRAYLSLGIIKGSVMRNLTEYLPREIFIQRKQYDEYYINVQHADIGLTLDKLMELSKIVEVLVRYDGITLKDYGY